MQLNAPTSLVPALRHPESWTEFRSMRMYLIELSANIRESAERQTELTDEEKTGVQSTVDLLQHFLGVLDLYALRQMESFIRRIPDEMEDDSDGDSDDTDPTRQPTG